MNALVADWLDVGGHIIFFFVRGATETTVSSLSGLYFIATSTVGPHDILQSVLMFQKKKGNCLKMRAVSRSLEKCLPNE